MKKALILTIFLLTALTLSAQEWDIAALVEEAISALGQPVPEETEVEDYISGFNYNVIDTNYDSISYGVVDGIMIYVYYVAVLPPHNAYRYLADIYDFFEDNGWLLIDEDIYIKDEILAMLQSVRRSDGLIVVEVFFKDKDDPF